LATTRAVASVLAPDIAPRVRRLVLSNRLLIAPSPVLPALSRLSVDAIWDVLRAQNFQLAEARGRTYLFDAGGFEGHSVRPVLASLLKRTKLNPLALHKKVIPYFLVSRPEVAMHLPEGAPLAKLQERWLRISMECDEQWQEFDEAYGEDPEAATLRFLRSYGSLRIAEFPLGDALERLRDEGYATEKQMADLFDSKERPLLRDAKFFRDWIETFVEGKGFHLVPDHLAEDHKRLRIDFGRTQGRLKGLKWESGQPPEWEFEGTHSTEAAIAPESEMLRQGYFCARVIERAKSER
jgi:hypothetical protein